MAFVAERVTEALREPGEIEVGPCIARASVGVAMGLAGFRTADEMVVAADHAMCEAKQGGGGRSQARRADRSLSATPQRFTYKDLPDLRIMVR